MKVSIAWRTNKQKDGQSDAQPDGQGSDRGEEEETTGYMGEKTDKIIEARTGGGDKHTNKWKNKQTNENKTNIKTN